MGSDYLARKTAKKSRKQERQDVKPRRERKKNQPRRLCRGTCYTPAPGLTNEDMDGIAPDRRPPPTAPVGELSKYANFQFGGGERTAAKPKAKAPRAKPARDEDGDEEPEAEQPRSAKRPRMSTAVSLLDAQTAKAQAPRRRAPLPPDASADADAAAAPSAFAEFPEGMQRYLAQEGYVAATPVQAACWPALLAGRDVQAVAEPGSGKTLAYLLPAAAALVKRGHGGASRPAGPLALVLAPTRELAAQVAGVARGLRRAFGGLRTACVTGGSDKEAQVAALGQAPHFVVATPGRLLDLVDAGHLTLAKVRYVVLDEADKMLGLGFAPQVDRLKEMLFPSPEAEEQQQQQQQREAGTQAKPKRRPQVGLFTATMPRAVRAVADAWLLEPERVAIAAAAPGAGGAANGGGGAQISSTVTQVVQVCAEHKKLAKLNKHLAAIRAASRGQRAQPRVLIFANRIKTVRFLHKELAASLRVELLHGERSQEERDAAVAAFRSGKAQILVASDVAARGLDIRGLPYVVNFDFPPDLDTYVHRVGRTGRLAADGHAFSFLTRGMAPLAGALVELLQAHAQALDPNLVRLAEAYEIAAQKLGLAGIDPGPAGGSGDEEEEGDGDESEGEEAGRQRRRAERPAQEDVLHALGMKTQQQKKREKAQAKRRGKAAAVSDDEGGSGSGGGSGSEDDAQDAQLRGKAVPAPQPEYIASKKFAGARAGYVFKRGGLGVGYYPDRPMLQQLQLLKKRRGELAAAAVRAPVGGRAKGDAGLAAKPTAKAVPLLPGRMKQLKRQRDAAGMPSDSDDEEGGGDGDAAGAKANGRPKKLPGRLRKKLAKERAAHD